MEAGPVQRLRWQRLRLTWALALPFLVLSDPGPASVFTGALVALPGLALRGWAAGGILKDQVLAVEGAYRHLRHPLYAGSFILGMGVMIGGGRWIFPVLFLPLFVWVYGRTIRAEEHELGLRFGSEYGCYREAVPAFLPQWPARPSARARSGGGPPGFRLRVYCRNKEWQAVIGTASVFGLLWLKAALLGSE